MESLTYDVIVIGGGPAGYTAAIRLGQLGLRALCVEREYMGGVCLNWGCIPSKALITAAGRWEALSHGGDMGIEVTGASIDFGRTQQWKGKIVEQLTSGVAGLVKSNGADVVMGNVRLTGSRLVEVTDASGAVRSFEASRALIVATGARPIDVPAFRADGRRILTAREAVSLGEIPRSLLVIGGGVIGIELGTLYSRLGSEVTIVELTPNILPGVDRDIVRVIAKRLEARGTKILTETRALGWREDGDSAVVALEGPAGAREVRAERVLVAIGFKPNTEGLGLEQVGISTDDRGHIRVDSSFRTSVDGIFAVGDVTGGPYLAHKAFKEAETAAEAVAGKHAARDWLALPAVIFSDPEIATVGLSEEAARAEGIEVEIGRFPFSVLGRSLSLGETDGFVKVVTGQDRVLGVGIVGPEASELIGEATFAIEMMAAPEDVGLTIHAHPTLSEALHEAMKHSVGEAIHIRNKPRKAAPKLLAG